MALAVESRVPDRAFSIYNYQYGTLSPQSIHPDCCPRRLRSTNILAEATMASF